MAGPLSFRRLDAASPTLAPLRAEARAEGFAFLERLVAEWASGENRFDGPGEALLGAYEDGALAAVGGLCRDPYVSSGENGRLRRFYVARAARGRGLGRALVERLIAGAGGIFGEVRLRTDTAAAAAFYVACGFTAIDEAEATHRLVVRPLRSDVSTPPTPPGNRTQPP